METKHILIFCCIMNSILVPIWLIFIQDVLLIMIVAITATSLVVFFILRDEKPTSKTTEKLK